MRLFEAVPSDLFSVLASPNRELYADALDVLYEVYGDGKLKIPESAYYMMLRSKLEQQLAQTNFEDEDIDEEELRDISGRARFLIRKLGSKGWFEKERGRPLMRWRVKSRSFKTIWNSIGPRWKSCAKTSRIILLACWT